MVNMEMVKRKLARGIATGVGVFGSTFVGNAISNNANFGDLGVAASQMVLGAGVAVGSGRVAGAVGNRQGLVEIGVEHIGYGIHGAGFAEAADQLNASTSAHRSMSNPDRTIEVNANAQQASEQSASRNADFSLDTA